MNTGTSIPITRYSQRPFPDYRFVPGRAPHPTRDPQGHSYNTPEEKLDRFDPAKWSSCDCYLYGIDLFNHAYWWEAHEALETVWIAAGRHSRTGLFIQGLIQIAVAHLKNHQDFTGVAQRMARSGLDKMAPVKGIFLGIDTGKFRKDVRDWMAGRRTTPVLIELRYDNQ